MKKALTDAEVRAIKPKATKRNVAIGESLLLAIYPSGGKYFVWRYRFPPGRSGQLRDYQIGPYGTGAGHWTLRQARQERERLEVLRREGVDPRALKSEARQGIQSQTSVTFADATEAWMKSISSKLAPSTLKDYRNKVENQILHVFGRRSIMTITRSECLEFKRTIEARGAKSQSDKVFLLLRQIFSYAIDHEWIEDPNPARSSRHSRSGHVGRNHPSLEWCDVPKFLADLSQNTGNGDLITQSAVKVLLITFMRVGAIVPAQWSEINWEKRTWIIPSNRMKARHYEREEHTIPMPQPLIEIFMNLHQITGHSPYIFLSSRGKQSPHISKESPNHLIKRMGYQGRMVAHGARKLAVTNGQDILKTPYHVIDLQMGHKQKGKVRQAYDNAEYLEERTEFMKLWGDLLVRNGLVA